MMCYFCRFPLDVLRSQSRGTRPWSCRRRRFGPRSGCKWVLGCCIHKFEQLLCQMQNLHSTAELAGSVQNTPRTLDGLHATVVWIEMLEVEFGLLPCRSVMDPCCSLGNQIQRQFHSNSCKEELAQEFWQAWLRSLHLHRVACCVLLTAAQVLQ